MKNTILILLITLAIVSCDTNKKKEQLENAMDTPDQVISKVDIAVTNFEVNPISHATMVLAWDSAIIYVDPVGGAAAFADFPAPDLVLVTDIHGDHMNVDTLLAIVTENTVLIAPDAVAQKFPEELKAKTTILANGNSVIDQGLTGVAIEAIPMYNLRKEALKFHAKGRGNGYVLSKNGKRVYISGDTEHIPEMRALNNIDVAFVCMNLPYTMTVESAASAVIEFAPKQVYPYHYRGTEGLSNVPKFKELVNAANSAIDVIQLDWYSE